MKHRLHAGPRGWMTNRISAAGLALLVAALCTSCKLVELKMPGEPMSKEDFALRSKTREFAGVVSATVQQAADEIAHQSQDQEIKTRAVQWKIGAVSVIRGATLRSTPSIALVDSWAFCNQMTQFLEQGEGAKLFGAQQTIAVKCAQDLESRMKKTAETVLASARFSKMQSFVTNYTAQFPLKTLSFDRESVSARWEDFLGEAPPAAAAGTGSEAMSDLAERLQILGQQVPDEVRWRFILGSEELQRNMARTGVTLDRLEDTMKQIGDAAAAAPTIASNTVTELRTGFLPVLEKLQTQWGTTVSTLQQERVALAQNIASERAEILKVVDQQRASIMKETQEMSRDLVERSMNHLRGLIRDVLFYAVILVALILGLPFVIGLFLGRAWGRGTLRKTQS